MVSGVLPAVKVSDGPMSLPEETGGGIMGKRVTQESMNTGSTFFVPPPLQYLHVTFSHSSAVATSPPRLELKNDHPPSSLSPHTPSNPSLTPPDPHLPPLLPQHA